MQTEANKLKNHFFDFEQSRKYYEFKAKNFGQTQSTNPVTPSFSENKSIKSSYIKSVDTSTDMVLYPKSQASRISVSTIINTPINTATKQEYKSYTPKTISDYSISEEDLKRSLGPEKYTTKKNETRETYPYIVSKANIKQDLSIKTNILDNNKESNNLQRKPLIETVTTVCTNKKEQDNNHHFTLIDSQSKSAFSQYNKYNQILKNDPIDLSSETQTEIKYSQSKQPLYSSTNFKVQAQTYPFSVEQSPAEKIRQINSSLIDSISEVTRRINLNTKPSADERKRIRDNINKVIVDRLIEEREEKENHMLICGFEKVKKKYPVYGNLSHATKKVLHHYGRYN